MIRDPESVENATPLSGSGPAKFPAGTTLLAALEELGIVGMWEDRNDIDDSGAFARDLRKRSETRNAE